MADWPAILSRLVDAGIPLDPSAMPEPVGGGDINDAWRAPGSRGPVFLKTGPVTSEDMFAAEAEGLAEIAATGTVRVPAVLGTGSTGPVAWLALEWVPFDRSTPETDHMLGERLALMHRNTADRHGWHRDNTIGSTPQINTQTDAWADFYRDHRLGYQLATCARYGYGGELQSLGRRLLDNMANFFGGHRPVPSLLHGDLWGGNHAASGGEPLIFDPAVYYGDRETDIAMTKLFGGFSEPFYRAYEEAWPLPAGHERRLGVYQLYHVLNHLNLFGRAYLGRAEALLREAVGAIS